jgi:hypothetical protein
MQFDLAGFAEDTRLLLFLVQWGLVWLGSILQDEVSACLTDILLFHQGNLSKRCL